MPFLSEVKMRVAWLAASGLAVTVLMLGAAREASACSCEASGAPCQAVFQADAVFAGTVTSIFAVPEDAPPLPPNSMRIPRALRVEFTDVLPLRGVEGATAIVSTPGSGPACGYRFQPGERYLVYARRSPEGTGLVTGICSRTRLLAQAEEDLRFLRSLPELRETGARVSGKIFHAQVDLATDVVRGSGPVQGVLVTLRGPDGTFEARTDAAGHYEVTVPPGKYEATAIPPAAFSTRYLTRSIELRDGRACFIADFSLEFDGRVRGTIRQSTSEPADRIAVQLMAVDAVGRTGRVRTLGATTDAGGRFEFIEVPPGR